MLALGKLGEDRNTWPCRKSDTVRECLIWVRPVSTKQACQSFYEISTLYPVSKAFLMQYEKSYKPDFRSSNHAPHICCQNSQILELDIHRKLSSSALKTKTNFGFFSELYPLSSCSVSSKGRKEQRKYSKWFFFVLFYFLVIHDSNIPKP